MSKWHSCLKKQRFLKKEAEEMVVKRYFQKNGRGGKAYECENCGWWHLTRARFPGDKEWSNEFRAKLGLAPKSNLKEGK